MGYSSGSRCSVAGTSSLDTVDSVGIVGSSVVLETISSITACGTTASLHDSLTNWPMLTSSTMAIFAFDYFLTAELEDPRDSSRPINAVKDISVGSPVKIADDVLGLA